MHNFYNNIVIGTKYLTHYCYHKASLVAKFGMFMLQKRSFEVLSCIHLIYYKKYNIYPSFIFTSQKIII